MKLSNSFTYRIAGLDRSVFWLFAISFLIASTFLGYKAINYQSCTEVVMIMSSSSHLPDKKFLANEIVQFSAPLDESSIVTWDFGDGQDKVVGYHVTHIFKDPGKFVVSVSIDGRCSTRETVYIQKFEIPKDLDKNNQLVKELTNPIQGNFATVQGGQLVFTSSVDASSYEWSIVDDKQMPIIRSPKAAFTFISLKPYKLKLVLNENPAQTWYRDIIVNRLPVPEVNPNGGASSSGGGTAVLPLPEIPPRPAPTQPTAPPVENITTPVPGGGATKPEVKKPADPKLSDIYMDNRTWQEELQNLAKGDGNLSISEFKDYIHDTDSPIVLLNGQQVSFSVMYSKLYKMSRIEVESIFVDQEYDQKAHILKKLIVKYKEKKKGIFNL